MLNTCAFPSTNSLGGNSEALKSKSAELRKLFERGTNLYRLMLFNQSCITATMSYSV